jgi:hypothetical protein
MFFFNIIYFVFMIPFIAAAAAESLGVIFRAAFGNRFSFLMLFKHIDYVYTDVSNVVVVVAAVWMEFSCAQFG